VLIIAQFAREMEIFSRILKTHTQGFQDRGHFQDWSRNFCDNSTSQK